MKDNSFSSLRDSEAFRALKPEYANIFLAVMRMIDGVEGLATQLASGTNPAQVALAAQNVAQKASDIGAVELLQTLLTAQETRAARESAHLSTQQERCITLNRVLEYLQHHDGDELTWGYIQAAYDATRFEQRSKEIMEEIKAAKELAKKYDVTQYGILPKRMVD